MDKNIPWVILFAPLVSAVLIQLFLRKSRSWSATPWRLPGASNSVNDPSAARTKPCRIPLASLYDPAATPESFRDLTKVLMAPGTSTVVTAPFAWRMNPWKTRSLASE